MVTKKSDQTDDQKILVEAFAKSIAVALADARLGKSTNNLSTAALEAARQYGEIRTALQTFHERAALRPEDNNV